MVAPTPSPASVQQRQGVLSKRQCELLQAASAALEDYRAAPSHDLLVDHAVSIDEAHLLSEQMALAIQMLLQVNEETASESGLVRQVGMDRFVRALMAGEDRG